MKKLLLSILVAIAAVLSSCKATVDPDNAAAIAGTYKMSYYTYDGYAYNVYSYSTVSLTRKTNSTVDVSIYRYSTYQNYTDVKITKSGSNYTLSGKSNSGDSFTGSVNGNAIELGINESGYVYNIKGSK
ncbi:MAG: hypothetical protein RLZZ175_1286 [Bacteroidota bacterium]|jgi:hypothetical protein